MNCNLDKLLTIFLVWLSKYENEKILILVFLFVPVR